MTHTAFGLVKRRSPWRAAWCSWMEISACISCNQMFVCFVTLDERRGLEQAGVNEIRAAA